MKTTLPLLFSVLAGLCATAAAAQLPPDLARAVATYDAAQIKGDGAVMGGIATLSGTDAGKRLKVTLRFADIWAKRHGVWQVVYTHVSKPGK